jgi:hypothetical protein
MKVKITKRGGTPPTTGLNALTQVVLNDRNQRLLDGALRTNGGDPPWRARKAAEARDLLALSQIAPPRRFQVYSLEMSVALRALLWMQVPVACRPDQGGGLRIADHALLGLTYPRAAICQPFPGTAFMQILEPAEVWLPSVGAIGQPLCLGTQLPCGIPAKELVLMTYGALSMQTIQIDEQDPAGVLNAEAARWWQAASSSIPLSRTPFLKSDMVPDSETPLTPATTLGPSST